MKHRTHIIYAVLLCCLVLAGCFTSNPKAKETGKPSAASNVESTANALGTTATKLEDKSTNVENKETERDGKLVADINAAKNANQNNPPGVPKEQVDSHLAVAGGRLNGAKEDPVAKAAAAERDRLFELGRSAEARAATDKAVKDATTQAGELAVARQELKQVREELGKEVGTLKAEVTTLKATLAENLRVNQANIDKALDAERRANDRKLTWVLALGAIALCAIGAFFAYTKFNAGEPMKALIAGGFWGGAGGCCATFAWAINQTWFQQLVKWMLIGAGVLGLGASAAYIIAELRSAREKKDLAKTAQVLDKDATEADATILKVYDTLERKLPPEQLSALTKEFSGALNDNEKAYVNELKAIRQRARAAGAAVA
jgi:hypothetical protein